jgi:L-alanine-DL-glutamate epimerase-like enolase superfamily enzyme
LCKGDYDDGGQYCLGFGGASVDRQLGQELLKVISPFAYQDRFSIFLNPPRVDAAGQISVPSGPGLGVEINPDLMLAA